MNSTYNDITYSLNNQLTNVIIFVNYSEKSKFIV